MQVLLDLFHDLIRTAQGFDNFEHKKERGGIPSNFQVQLKDIKFKLIWNENCKPLEQKKYAH